MPRPELRPYLVAAGMFAALPATTQNEPKAKSASTPKSGDRETVKTGWKATGTLFEACSCDVPCPCNFGQSPSHGFCHTIYAYRLKHARYEDVTLDGFIFGGGEGPKGAAGFIEARATGAQRTALEKLATAVFGKGGASGGNRTFTPTTLVVEDTPSAFHVKFGDNGGFSANVLIGADGKNPIVVENNTTWPVRRFIKGKTDSFDYHDTVGNQLRYQGVNANLGEFDLSGNVTTARGQKTLPSCCTPKSARR